jgi:hypothetical protein|tara:strand:- start:537 stop:683 length:147 start_codon:yes stop_codon:yes gene_type:complete
VWGKSSAWKQKNYTAANFLGRERAPAKKGKNKKDEHPLIHPVKAPRMA